MTWTSTKWICWHINPIHHFKSKKAFFWSINFFDLNCVCDVILHIDIIHLIFSIHLPIVLPVLYPVVLQGFTGVCISSLHRDNLCPSCCEATALTGGPPFCLFGFFYIFNINMHIRKHSVHGWMCLAHWIHQKGKSAMQIKTNVSSFQYKIILQGFELIGLF